MENEKTTKTNWKPTDNRFIAFIDILGFKDLIGRKTHSEIYDQLIQISKTKKFLEGATLNKAVIKKYQDAEIYIVTFSDSIVVFSKNDNLDNFYYFLVSIRWPFAKTIEAKVPLKGAFAYGEVSLNKSEQIYFGQAIIDAYLMEEDVNYMGIVAHNSIDNYTNRKKEELDKRKEKLGTFLFEDKTPLKCGSLNHLNLNWFKSVSKLSENLSDEEKSSRIYDLINNFKYNTSGSPRKYIDNTTDFFKKGRESVKIVL